MLTEFLDRLVLVIGVSNNLRKWSPRAVDINWWRHLHSDLLYHHISLCLVHQSETVVSGTSHTDNILCTLNTSQLPGSSSFGISSVSVQTDLDLQSFSNLLIALPTPLMAMLMRAVFPTPRWRCAMSKWLIRSKRPQWCYTNPAHTALKMLNVGIIAGKPTMGT